MKSYAEPHHNTASSIPTLPERSADQPIVVFLHIPKTAGTTLRLIFKQYYSAGEVLEMDEGFTGLEQIMADKAALGKLKLVMGHSAQHFLNRYEGSVQLVSFVRDPFKRLVSEYAFVRFQKEHPRHKMAAGMTMEEYLIRAGLDDNQARFLAFEGVAGRSPHGHEERDSLLKEALCHLKEKFLFVGIAERFDESIVLLHRRLNWPRLPIYAPLNVGERRGQIADIRDKKSQIEQDYLSVDRQVYDYCLARFEGEWDAQKDENESQLAELRVMRQAVDELLCVRDGMLGYFKYLHAGPVRRAAYALLRAGDRLAGWRSGASGKQSV